MNFHHSVWSCANWLLEIIQSVLFFTTPRAILSLSLCIWLDFISLRRSEEEVNGARAAKVSCCAFFSLSERRCRRRTHFSCCLPAAMCGDPWAQPPHLISMFNCQGSECIQRTPPRCTASAARSARAMQQRGLPTCACAEKWVTCEPEMHDEESVTLAVRCQRLRYCSTHARAHSTNIGQNKLFVVNLRTRFRSQYN
jgi:hypothetical protein